MQEKLGGLSMDTIFLKIVRSGCEKNVRNVRSVSEVSAKSIKISKASQKKIKKHNPIHFHNTCFYQSKIFGKQAKQDT